MEWLNEVNNGEPVQLSGVCIVLNGSPDTCRKRACGIFW